MLNGIGKCLSPEIICAMMKMGHGDEIAFVDRDYPADTYGKMVIRADGIGMIDMLKDVLELLPLDEYVEKQAFMMAAVDEQPGVWKSFEKMIADHTSFFKGFGYIERYNFYDRTKGCSVIVVTGEADGNIILRKGVVSE